MFGLDERIATFSDGTTIVIVLTIAILLGLRHAGDPDHLVAVTTLIASGHERAGRRAAQLGFTWGLGHATSLFLFGLPVVLYSAYLPEPVQSAAETTVGLVIVALAIALLVRWHRRVHAQPHRHGADAHGDGTPPTRSAWQAYGIGFLHGAGGTAGVGLLLLATIHSPVLAIAALALFALFSAVSMALLSTGFVIALGSAPVRLSFDRIAPTLGVASLAFGVWYALGAQGILPYLS
jgi:high-affinity nickel permease